MTIGIIGYGQVSKSLINQRFVLENLKYIVIRNEKERLKFIALTQQYDISIYTEVNQISDFAELNLILVNDGNIIEVVNQLMNVNIINNQNQKQTTIFAHFSGVLQIDVLKKLKDKNFKTAKLHPFQTFAILNKEANIFKDVAFLCEYDNNDLDLKNILKEFINNLDAKFFHKNELKNFDEKLYHIIAVFSSNYLTSYLKMLIDLADNSGINKDFLLPIINTTINNIFENTVNNKSISQNKFPLSGPIARLDLMTIEKHIQILKDKKNNLGKDVNSSNDLLEFYTYFGKITSEIALKNGIFDVDEYEKLKKIFEM